MNKQMVIKKGLEVPSKLVALALLTSICTACSSTTSMFGGSDIQISATEAGMKAYGDHLNALITNGKASADAPDTPAYQLRRTQEEGHTLRKLGWKPNMVGAVKQPQYDK